MSNLINITIESNPKIVLPSEVQGVLTLIPSEKSICGYYRDNGSFDLHHLTSYLEKSSLDCKITIESSGDFLRVIDIENGKCCEGEIIAYYSKEHAELTKDDISFWATELSGMDWDEHERVSLVLLEVGILQDVENYYKSN
ncbi:hypothetical protein JHD46_05380 [Sulfurimonas sp. SAG-AH-194-C20]|nr:hypothetical protein [Sulfurimonas sp. SAG-AH-194-C20]MDF1879071.1 hypothetical protein [Sulfurimonas sp. SAG-AH-194-C20]